MTRLTLICAFFIASISTIPVLSTGKAVDLMSTSLERRQGNSGSFGGSDGKTLSGDGKRPVNYYEGPGGDIGLDNGKEPGKEHVPVEGTLLFLKN